MTNISETIAPANVMDKFVVAPEPLQDVKYLVAQPRRFKPPSIPEKSRVQAAKVFLNIRKGVVRFAVPAAAAIGTIFAAAGCAETPLNINPDLPASSSSSSSILEAAKEKEAATVTPQIHVSPKLYPSLENQLNIHNDDKQREKKFISHFEEKFSFGIKIMRNQFGKSKVISEDIFFYGLVSADAYDVIATVDGNPYVLVMHGTDGAWVRIPSNAKIADPDSGKTEVYSLNDGPFMFPMYRENNIPYDRMGILILLDGVRYDFVQKNNFWLSDHGDILTDQIILRAQKYPGESYKMIVRQFGYELQRILIMTDLLGNTYSFEVSDKGVIGDDKNKFN